MAFSNYNRETAKRVFAAEFAKSTLSKKFSNDDKAPTFVITPTGECANRLLISGVLISKERKEDKNNRRYYLLKVNDNTGVFVIMINNYTERAMQQVASIPNDYAFVTVVGKPTVSEMNDGRMFPMIRAEEIVVTDIETRNMWILDTARATKDRIEVLQTGDDDIVKLAREHYNNHDMKQYEEIIKKAVGSLAPKNLA